MSGGRIGYVLKVFPRVSETFVINEIRAMESLGEDVVIFSLHHPQAIVRHAILEDVRAQVVYVEDTLPDEERVRIARKELQDRYAIPPVDRDRFLPRKYVRLALALSELAREHEVNHLHAHFASRAGHVCAIAGGLEDRSYSTTAHAKDIYHADVDPDVLRWQIKNAKFFATVTDYNLRHLRALLEDVGQESEKVVRVYNGIDLERFRPSAPPPRHTPLVLSVGRLVEKKGFDVLIDACRLAAEAGRALDCEIIGTGDEEDVLRRQIAASGLADTVTLCGVCSTEEVGEWLQEATVVVLPCVAGKDGNVDALPTVLLEAMATARPVISTTISGIPEIIANGENGYLVPPHDVQALADAISKVLADPVQGARMGRAGRSIAQQKFDLYANAAQLRDLICADQGGSN